MKPRTRHRLASTAASVAATAMLVAGLSACDDAEPHSHADSTVADTNVADSKVADSDAAEHAVHADGVPASQVALHTAMRQLWVEHMEWTYATIAAFAVGSPGLDATLTRLLQNQADIGDAVKPFYGDDAGAALTGLLEDHINGAVPILVAARDGDTKALNPAVKDWYANAKEIGDFLAGANPNWDKADMRKMMKGHIDQTLAYATAQLQGDYEASIESYGTAEQHMLHMADMLTQGLIEQFPEQFED